MKIITQGQLPQEKLYRTTCSSCCTVFEFKRDEATLHSDQRDGDYLSITCPLDGCDRVATIAASSSGTWYR